MMRKNCSETFTLIRSPAPKTKKSGQAKVESSSTVRRALSFSSTGNTKLVEKVLKRKKNLDEKDEMIKLLQEENAKLRAEKGMPDAEWQLCSNERGHKKQRTGE